MAEFILPFVQTGPTTTTATKGKTAHISIKPHYQHKPRSPSRQYPKAQSILLEQVNLNGEKTRGKKANGTKDTTMTTAIGGHGQQKEIVGAGLFSF